MSPQWCGARWRWQCAVSKGFVNSTDVVSAATTPRCSIEITCNQVNFLRNHDSTESEDELLGNPFLFGIDVADMKRQHRKIFLPAYWRNPSLFAFDDLSRQVSPGVMKVDGLDIDIGVEGVLVEENRATCVMSHVEPTSKKGMVDILSCFL